ncbi:TetR/AcrR family transcriptional regulator [Streptomyces sp. NP160]|uniref:TetR/AcrR family transcriptional regulator n=1 Tax=Streptomyces sp. NP160 TaxID=2586637 RepID=UPI001C59D127|nr:TetR/AcrR family transcriptional regulator [Streptomyces sp. NP160]
MEAVVSEAVALLDEAGEGALTFRALAARLGGGVGSIYWYVSSKDELVARASDHVVAGVLAATEGCTAAPDPVDDVRAIAVAFFDALAARPWLGAYFLRDVDLQPHALRLFERLGQQVMRLHLQPRQTFHAVSAVLGYVTGIAADHGHRPPVEGAGRSGGADAAASQDVLAEFVAQWRALDPEEYPFVQHVVEEFAVHDDRDQFLAGLDLLLAGLRLQASGRPLEG